MGTVIATVSERGGGSKMATSKQKKTEQRNIPIAEEDWREVAPAKHSKSQSEGKKRAAPGSSGKGEYYHIEVRPTADFVTFRTQDIGEKGGIQRVGGMRSNGSWDDQKWLISKDDAHIENDKLVPDTEDAREVLEALGSVPVHVAGDRFTARPRPNVSEKDKPTPAQQRTQKAKAARRS
jgi:hypothetical protein